MVPFKVSLIVQKNILIRHSFSMMLYFYLNYIEIVRISHGNFRFSEYSTFLFIHVFLAKFVLQHLKIFKADANSI